MRSGVRRGVRRGGAEHLGQVLQQMAPIGQIGQLIVQGQVAGPARVARYLLQVVLRLDQRRLGSPQRSVGHCNFPLELAPLRCFTLEQSVHFFHYQGTFGSGVVGSGVRGTA